MYRLFILSLAFSCLLIADAFSEPKLEVIGGNTYNWNTVKPKDSPLKAKIQLKNSGTDSLFITNVKPTCGCTTAPLDKSNLAPGEIATLDVTLRISSHGGNLTKAISISSNDAKEPRQTIYLKANVVLDLEVKPSQYFTFNTMKVGFESASTVKIINKSNQNITLSDFDYTPSDLIINVKNNKVLKPGEELEVIAKITPKKKGYFNCTFKCKTSNPDYPELAIPGYGNVEESPIFNN